MQKLQQYINVHDKMHRIKLRSIEIFIISLSYSFMISGSKRKYNQDNHFFMKKDALCKKLDVKENVLNNSITRLRKLELIISSKNLDLTSKFFEALSEFINSSNDEIKGFEILHSRNKIANLLSSRKTNANKSKDSGLSQEDDFNKIIDEIFSSATKTK